ADLVLSCQDLPLTPVALDYTNNSPGACSNMGSVLPTQTGDADICGGTITYTWTFTDQCGNTIDHIQNITIEPAAAPVFTDNLPQDMTVPCNTVPSAPPSLNYSNSEIGICEIAGSIPAVQTGSFDECGGSLTYVWSFTDQCGRTIEHQQVIIIEPAPMANFIDLPFDITVDCSQAPTSAPELAYTNGASGFCEIAGSIPATQFGAFDGCGGSITYAWTFIDNCNRIISHTQNVQISPAPDPAFIDPPADLTIACDASPPSPVDLNYTNGESGICAIDGTVSATVSTTGLTTEYTWTFLHPCTNNSISHTQIISQEAAPDPVLNPEQASICEGDNFDLSSVMLNDLNGGSPIVTYHSASPANASNELPSTTVNPSTSTTYYFLATNSSGCSAEIGFDLNVEMPPFAGGDGSSQLCFEATSSINLFDFLPGNPVQTGTWSDPNGQGIDLSNPFAVDLSGFGPGVYVLEYEVDATAVCPSDVASLNLELFPEVIITATDIACSINPNFYEVQINTNGFTVMHSVGTYTDLGSNLASVTDIPIDQPLVLNASDPNNPACTNSLSITPPDCNCPSVAPPVNDGDVQVCFGDPVPSLSVSVGTDETANWYDVPTGGTPLSMGSTQYTPMETAVGLYTFYVETQEIASGCISSVRTPVQLSILENPSGNDAQLSTCDTDGDGIAMFDLSMANDLIAANPSYSYTFYASLVDAQNGTNPLPVDYSNTVPNNQTLFVQITGNNNCTNIVSLELIVLPQPAISLLVNPETCLDAMDGSVSIDSPTGTSFSLDSMNWSNNNTFSGLAPGDYVAYVTDDNDCAASQTFSIDPGLSIQPGSLEVLCDNNGTASDATDDFYVFTFTLSNNQNNTGTYQLSDGTDTWGPFNYGELQTLNFPAMGQTLNLVFTDNNQACTFDQSIGPLNSCSTDCLLNINELDLTCLDNGTASDPSDDFYEVTLNVSAINGSITNTYDVLINGLPSFTYLYGTSNTFPLPADGSTPLLAIVDSDDPQCQETPSIVPLVPCSDACLLQIDGIDFTCNNNGSVTDPSDDFYELSVQVSVLNPGSSNSFEVFADNVSVGVFTYAAPANFNLPATGNAVNIRVEDSDDNICFAEQNVGPLESCEQDCSINATLSNITCDDNGTGTDPSDDTFTFDLLVDGQNTGSGWQATDGSISGTYGTVENFGPFPIAGGSIDLELEDLTTTTCFTSILVDPPNTCSDDCLITIDQLNFNCDDNGTITDPADDFYIIDIQASAINPGNSNSFEVLADNVSVGIFDYDTGGSFNLPASGNTVNIRVQDSEITSCLAEQNIGPLESCEEDCTISATVSNLACDDNGTGTDPSDDTFTFDLLVNGQNTGSGWQATDGSISGSYGTVETYGPFPIASGSIDLELEDLTTTSCIAPILVDPPNTCSDDCLITIDQLNFNCDDNGTITDPTDDFYIIDIQASAINPGISNSFEVLVDNVSVGIFDYDTGGSFNLPANGNTVNIRVQDSEITSCLAEQNIGPLESCEEDCTISATVSNLICDDNGTGADPNDDTFTFDLLVNGQNIGNGWQATDGSISGTYGNIETYGPFPIAGGSIDLELEDLITPGCITPILVNPPTTCSSCPETVDAGPGGILTCLEPNFELQGSASSTGTYIWTGPNGFSANTLNTTINSPGWYYLSGGFPNACTAIDSVFIELNEGTPLPNAGPDLLLTCVQETVVLDGTASNGTENTQWTWLDANGVILAEQPTFVTDQPGVYTLLLTDTLSGCSASDFVNVGEDTALPSAVIYADPDNILDCIVTTVVLSTDNEPDVVYSWNSFVAPQIVVSDAGLVNLLALDTISGCENTNQINITDLQDYPNVQLSPAAALTCYDPQVIIDGSASQVGTNIIYQWFDATNNIINDQSSNSLTVANGGWYFLELQDTINGCANRDSVLVEDLMTFPLSQGVDPVNLFCGANETTLALNIDALDDLTINWSSNTGTIISGGSTPTPLVNDAGSYYVEIQDTISGCITVDSTTVNINTEVPEFSIANIQSERCLGNNDGAINVTNVSGGTPPYAYLLDNQFFSDNGLFTNLAPGQYELEIADANGCLLDTFFRIPAGVDLEIDLPEIIEILEGQTGDIRARVSVPIEELSFIQWTPQGLLSCDSCLTTTANLVEDETFQLTIIHNNGCATTALLNIFIRPAIRVYIPNAFSP
ncbi:MAG: SprB repeat-containing protein, partial [Bacteroidota bacterium]